MRLPTLGILATVGLTLAGAASLTAQIRVAAFSSNSGNRCADQVFSSGDLTGTITRIFSAATINAMTPAQLRASYDVLLVTWNSSSLLDLDFNTRLRPYLELGGGVIFEDPNNIGDLAPAVQGSRFDVSGGITVSSVVPGLTDTVTNEFVNGHIRMTSWSAEFAPFITRFGTTVGLYGEFAGGGRMIVTGPDQDFHGFRNGFGASGNMYRLLRNALEWVSSGKPAQIRSDPRAPDACGGIAVITVEPEDASGNKIGPGQAVVISTTAGTLLGGVVDVGDGTYTQSLRADPNVLGALVSATVNGTPLPQTLDLHFDGGGPLDPGKSSITADPIPACGGTGTVTVRPANARGELICRPGLGVLINTSAGILLGTVVEVGDGTYTRTLQADPLVATATLSATIDGLPIPAGTADFTGGGAVDRIRSTITGPFALDACEGKSQMQGIRITRVDGGGFDMTGMNLFGQASIGQLTDIVSGAGTFALYNGGGTFSTPDLISFGAAFVGVSEVFLVDPAVAGGAFSFSCWDNIALQSATSGATTITFSEAVQSTPFGGGFDGSTNQFLLSADGQYRVEAFWLNNANGHLHLISGCERNHNFEAGNTLRNTGTITVTPRNLRSEVICRPGLAVTVNASAGTMLGTVTENGDGTYSQDLMSDPLALSGTITAIVDGANLATSRFVRFTGGGPADPFRSTITGSPTQMTCDGETTVVATPRNARSEPICRSGLTVAFSSADGVMQGSVVRVGDTYRQVFKVNPVVTQLRRTARVGFSVDGVPQSNQAFITVEPVDISKSSISPNPGVLLFGGRSEILVTLRDCGGNPLTGTSYSVAVSTTLGTLQGGSFATNNGDGTYSKTLNVSSLGTADIGAVLNGLFALDPVSVNVIDPNAIGRVVGIDSGDQAHAYVSIQQAVNAVVKDDLVGIFPTPGVYHEVVRIRADAGPIILQGLSLSQMVCVDGVRLQGANGARLEYFDVDGSQVNERGIRILDAHGIKITSCMVRDTQKGKSGIEIGDGSQALIDSCMVTNSSGDGMEIKSTADVEIRNCVVDQSGRNGLDIKEDAEVRVVQSRLEGSKQNGVDIRENASVFLDTCTIRDNAADGILVRDSQDVTLFRGSVQSNGKCGLELKGGSKAGMTSVNISNNSQHGIELGEAAEATASSCSVFANKQSGVRLKEAASLLFVLGSVSSNTLSGVHVGTSATVTFQGTFIGSNGQNGLHINESATVIATTTPGFFGTQTRVQSNGQNGISVSGATLTLEGATVSGNTRNGVEIGDGSTVVMRDQGFRSTSIFSNIANGILVGKATLSLQSGFVQSNGEIGIALAADSTATLEQNFIRFNGNRQPFGSPIGYGVFVARGVLDPRNITLRLNGITNNRGLVVPQQSDANVGNFDQIIDATDNQSPY